MPVSSGKLFEILGNVSAGHYLRPCAWSFDTCSCGLTIVSFISPSSTSYEMCAQALSDQSIFAGSSSSDRHFLFVQRKKEVERGGGGDCQRAFCYVCCVVAVISVKALNSRISSTVPGSISPVLSTGRPRLSGPISD